LSEKRETLADFYRKTIDIIFAFIIGQSFLSIDPMIKSVRQIVEIHNLINFGAIAFAYFAIIIGWIAYHKSIMDKPHKGKFGNARYVIDLMILFLMYYLLRLTKIDIGVPYSETFLWVLPSIFILYTLWDIFKFYEYSNTSKKRLLISATFGMSFVIMALVYNDVSRYLNANPEDYWDNKSPIDVYFLIASIILMLIYRIRKWDVRETKPPKIKPRKGR
jgi:hypothetical protein